MKISPSKNDRASVLVASLVVLGLLALTLLATLSMVSSQRGNVSRAQSWNAAIPMCEAGIEDAMAHLNYTGTTNLGSDGWTLNTSNYLRTNTMSGGYYSVAISTSLPPVITSQGYIFDPLKSNYLTRIVQVTTKGGGQFPEAILAKSDVTINSSKAYVDSFNSTDPAYSTGGAYDPTKAEANATVATVNGNIGIGSSKVYGNVAMGPGGTESGGPVGDATYDASYSGVQSGHSTTDVNTIIPDVTLPDMSGALTLTKGTNTVNGTNYDYKLQGGNYITTSDPSLGTMIVTGPSTLFVSNSLTIKGNIYIAPPSGSLQLYVLGSSIDVQTSGSIVNGSGTATNCQIWGLPTLNSIKFAGGVSFVGTIKAPEADCKFTGNSDFTGALVAKSVTIRGNTAFHYDESLGSTNGYKYLVTSWQEK